MIHFFFVQNLETGEIVRECYFIGKEEVDSSNLFNSSNYWGQKRYNGKFPKNHRPQKALESQNSRAFLFRYFPWESSFRREPNPLLTDQGIVGLQTIVHHLRSSIRKKMKSD